MQHALSGLSQGLPSFSMAKGGVMTGSIVRKVDVPVSVARSNTGHQGDSEPYMGKCLTEMMSS